MHLIDYSIIGCYFAVLILFGLYLRKRASRGLDEYFLGGRKIPWWVLGVSGMASNLDMTGTMVIISFFYILGVKGFLIELRGGVCLAMAFFMVILGKWHSRAGVMTIAEWMEFRFGKGKQGEIARLLSALAAVITTVGMVAYFFVGTGKFLSLFLPFSPKVCSLIMIAVALFYTVLSGLYGVVYTDLFQSLLIGFAAIFISVKAFMSVDYAAVQAITPPDWTNVIPSWRMAMPSGYEIYNLLGLSVIFYFLKVFIEGFGGPQGYTAQRYFSVKSDRESGLFSMLWISLLSFRWPFIIAIALLGFTLGPQVTDPEMVLPMVLVHLIPTGIKGLMIAALIAAAMSTFDSTINAGASYLINDIYRKYITPTATEKQLIRASYGASIIIVILGIVIGVITPTINTIWGWITMSLGAGMFIPLFVRWYWWRLNGYGFAMGTAVGIIGAILQKALFPYWPEWRAFLIVSLVSLCGMMITTLLTEATPSAVLNNFYSKTRPFGFWHKVRQGFDQRVLSSIRKETRCDLLALAFAIPWHLALFLTPVHLVLHHWSRFYLFLSILVISSIGLYFFWYKNLDRDYSKE